MDNKLYGFGLITGRFQPLHSGHEMMINTALTLCSEVGILIGSAQESGTANNPFSYEDRKKMLTAVFGSSVLIAPLPDMHFNDCAKWGQYVIESAEKHFGKKPDILISGKEKRRLEWLSSGAAAGTAELYLPKNIKISAVELRALLLNGNYDECKEYMPGKLWDSLDGMRAVIAASNDNVITESV